MTLVANLSCENYLLYRPLRHLLFVAKLIKDNRYGILILMINEENISFSSGNRLPQMALVVIRNNSPFYFVLLY